MKSNSLEPIFKVLIYNKKNKRSTFSGKKVEHLFISKAPNLLFYYQLNS